MAKTKKKEHFPKVYKDSEKIFTIVQLAEENFRIALGNEVVEEKVFKSRAAAQAHIDKKGWEMAINVFCVVSKKIYEQLKLQDNEKAN